MIMAAMKSYTSLNICFGYLSFILLVQGLTLHHAMRVRFTHKLIGLLTCYRSQEEWC